MKGLDCIHHIHKWPPCSFLFVSVFKEIHVTPLPSTAKYVILESFSVFGLTAAKLWLIQIQDIRMGQHNKASLASLSCFRQNSIAYNFSSNENITLQLHIMTRFGTIFVVIQVFL